MLLFLFFPFAGTFRRFELQRRWWHRLAIVALFASALIAFGLTLALLFSVLIESQYVAPLAGLGIVILLAYTFSGNDFLAYSPILFMTGIRYFNRLSGTLVGPVPWLPALAFIAAAVCIFAVSVKVIERRDF